MRIAVLLKEVPDTYSDREMNLETGLTDRSGDVVVDEVGERAVEAALRIAEAAGESEVEVLSVGPVGSVDSIRKAIAMGASEAYLVSDESLIGADLTLTAEVLAALVKRGSYDLVVAGASSSDGGGGVVASLIGELLDYPALTNLTECTVESGKVSGTQASDGAEVTLSADLPAVVSVSDGFADARFPNFKGLMAAKKKEMNKVTLAELGEYGVDPEDWTRPRSIMVSIAQRPERERGEIINGGPQAAAKLVDFLEAKGLTNKEEK
ncbi:electron transfer flavoprotein subunit beta/FixA family protein [Corynebacterium liangguodongii]|uniref:Electron transfer flavoprotein subunit beta n=1 Tax=Corynebacterium liangguodongii TaxID=2079535 RepID=A0A2S0WFN9_9CORY|nr:electron transfer flavoprotein subunit beta/FixA family protein [Corynebacterium liangguodongii]AWB84534.1 electron transfer flavoprotein subunit beta [Corynebacterium liangguodongii]PWB98882.1 electron transfer flavoprotein subunit beta/FixA family protein [Corynebacterium liangguodongii]